MKSRFAKPVLKNAFNAVAPPTASRFPVTSSAPSSSAAKSNRDYFDDDDDEIVAPSTTTSLNENDDDYDPLDAFMADNQQVVQKQNSSTTKREPLPEIVSAQDIDDDFNDYYSSSKSKGGAKEGTAEDILDLDDYTEDDKNNKNKAIEPLAAVDHTKITYAPFTKCFYKESAEISAMSESEVTQYREELEIHMNSYKELGRPIKTFKQAGFDPTMLKEIERAGYTAPTPIQAQTLPLALSGRDIIGLAKTGSGKTLAYVWPIIVHILNQPQMKLGDGPIALVLAPTRELASQIHVEAKKFAKIYNIRSVVVYGGAGKYEMVKALKESPELVIATPGRFIEMVKSKATSLERCTLAVLDEADRMFEMGFEYQMRSIVNNIRPHDRQILMFSATMKKKIEGFAREILSKDSVRIVIGSIGQANPDIQQIVHVLPSEQDKFHWLTRNIEEFAAEGKVLVFVLSKVDTEELCKNIKMHFSARCLSVNVDCLHGDRDQSERSIVMSRFKTNTIYDTNGIPTSNSKSTEISILIATDIAARGLDVKDIRTVVNFDAAKNVETYVHRIGRTGRMGLEGVTPGTAYTLLTSKDSSFAVDLVQNLNLSKQHVTPELQKLAENDPKWSRVKHLSANFGSKGGSSFGQKAGLAGGIGFVSASAPGGGNLSSVSGSAPKAATSFMLAQESKSRGVGHDMQFSSSVMRAYDKSSFQSSHQQHQSSVSVPPAIAPPPPREPESYQANPYIEGHSQGRGKHLNVPSWMSEEGLTSSSSSKGSAGGGVSAVSEQSAVEAAMDDFFGDATATSSGTSQRSGAAAAVKRKSRFADSTEEDSVVVPDFVSPPVPVVVRPVLSGFVRASDSASIAALALSAPPKIVSVPIVHLPPPLPIVHLPETVTLSVPKKKSRWDV